MDRLSVGIRPLILNSEDTRGGAALAANRLYQGLRSIGVDCRMLVQVKHGDDYSVIGPKSVIGKVLNPLRPAADLLPVLAYSQRTGGTFYPGWLPDRLGPRVSEIAPSIVHLHWIAGGFLNVRSLRRFGLPLIWTLHDMWAFTGGCHYDGGCGNHRSMCGRCPVLRSGRSRDLSTSSWKRKRKAYRDLPLTLVSPSRWLASEASASQLLGASPIQVIPNGIDIGVYRPFDRPQARDLLRLPADCKLILFGALGATSDSRKGFTQLQHALERLALSWQGISLRAVVFGASQPERPPAMGVPVIYAGSLADDLTLALLYSAADVYVAPSLQENLSNTVMEALACGTPCVAFDVGGMRDMIEHQRNGYLARPFISEDLAAGIRWTIEDQSRWLQLHERARNKVIQEFHITDVARRYRDLYTDTVARAAVGVV